MSLKVSMLGKPHCKRQAIWLFEYLNHCLPPPTATTTTTSVVAVRTLNEVSDKVYGKGGGACGGGTVEKIKG